MARNEFTFTVHCQVKVKDGKLSTIFLDSNDWGDCALDSYPDLSDEEYAAIEGADVKTLQGVKVDWM